MIDRWHSQDRLWAVVAMVVLAATLGTTTIVEASPFTYDAPANARGAPEESVGTDVPQQQLSGRREVSAPRGESHHLV